MTRRAWALAAIFALVGCAAEGMSTTPALTSGGTMAPPTHAFVIDDLEEATLFVTVADDDAERERGLMGVPSLPGGVGMAFVYDEPSMGSFLMKDTLVPLSIAFVDETERIVTIREMTPCESDPCPTYAADSPYVLAVEAAAGWFGHVGAEVGDHAELTAL